MREQQTVSVASTQSASPKRISPERTAERRSVVSSQGKDDETDVIIELMEAARRQQELVTELIAKRLKRS